METIVAFGDLWSIKLILWLKEYFIPAVGIIVAVWIIRPLASYIIQLFMWIIYVLLFIPYILAYLFLILFNLLPNSIIEKCSGFITFCERKVLYGVRNTQNSLATAVRKVNTNVTKAHRNVKKGIKIAVTSFFLVTALALIYEVFIMKYTTVNEVFGFFGGQL
jgi:hypothetical protein